MRPLSVHNKSACLDEGQQQDEENEKEGDYQSHNN